MVMVQANHDNINDEVDSDNRDDNDNKQIL